MQTSRDGLVARARKVSLPELFAASARASNEPLGARVTRVIRAMRLPFWRRDDVPAHAVAVLVDLELDLDPAVLVAELQLRRARPSCTCRDADVAVLRDRGRRGGERERRAPSSAARIPTLDLVIFDSSRLVRSLAQACRERGSRPQLDIGRTPWPPRPSP